MKTTLLCLMLTVPAGLMAQQTGAAALPPSGSVAVPLDEYNKMVELAAKPVTKPEAPPVAYSIHQAGMKLKVTGESAGGTIDLEGEILGKGAVKVPLVTGMTVVDAKAEGRPVPLQQAEGTHSAILSGPGAFALTVEIGVALKIEAGKASLELPVPWAGATCMRLELPGENTNAALSAGLITRRTSGSGQTTIEALLVPGRRTTVSWATREKAAPAVPREVRFLSDVKTLVSVSDGRLGLVSLAEVTVVQGEPAQFELAIPVGYEVREATGAAIESSEIDGDVLVVKVAGAAQRSYSFLVSMERSAQEAKAEVPLVSVKGAQRETGEVLVESEGAMELTAKESGALKRMDLREVDATLRSLAQHPLQAAFRYHRQPAEAAGLALDWVRFPDSAVQAAVAQRAVVTTLVTSQGRSLTEVRLTVSNQAQPFLRVNLPAGASILSAEVAGGKVKPVEGADGSRVPLLRTGFRPTGPYEASFVFVHSGAPFAKKGGADLSLPKMDVPIGLLEWEVFLPEQYKVKDFGGDALTSSLFPDVEARVVRSSDGAEAGWQPPQTAPMGLGDGQIGGVVYDASGAVIPNAKVVLRSETSQTTRDTATNGSGYFNLLAVAPGSYRVTVVAPGFTRWEAKGIQVTHGGRVNLPSITLNVRGAKQEVTVVSAAEMAVPVDTGQSSTTLDAGMISGLAAPQSVPRSSEKPYSPLPNNAASANVFSLQRRVAGVLPIAVDVPREGNSYRFVRPLVLDEETKVTFSYRAR